MPLYKFRAIEGEKGCDKCLKGFSRLLKSGQKILFCPDCGSEVEKVIETVNILPSKAKGEASSDRLDELGLTQMTRKPDGTWRIKGRPLSENDSVKPDFPKPEIVI